jgi:hypothetical protein
VPSLTKVVFTLNSPTWQGEHGKICKVKIENFDQLPSYIEFVGNKLKMKDNYEA